MTRIDSGSTTRKFYFEAVDTTGLELTGLVAGDFTVRRSRDGGTLTAYSSPTITELDATNAAGIYVFTADEDTSVDGGDYQEMLITIDSAANNMVQVRKAIELVRPKTTLGTTVNVVSGVVEANMVQSKGSTSAPDVLAEWLDGGRLDSLLDTTNNNAGAANSQANSLISQIGVGGVNLSAVPYNAGWDAQFQSQVVAAMNTQGVSPARAANLDNLDTAVSGVSGGATQPRQNKRAAGAYRFKISSMADGTYKATRTCRLRPGAVNVAIELIMDPVFGDDYVVTVGTPDVAGFATDPSVTATALGPRDTSAMIQLAGTAVANETGTIEALVTMDNGDAIPVTLDVKVFDD